MSRLSHRAVLLLLAASPLACATEGPGPSATTPPAPGLAGPTGPVLRGERAIEDAGARLTGTEPAYKQGGSFFINQDDARPETGTP